jgi:SAM-dependent methyltransferase
MTGEHRDEQGGEAKQFAKQFWEEHYRSHQRAWSGRANAVLVEVAGPLPPGTALDLGCAEGADAIWLAGLGWRVTAVDVSATALERAAIQAATSGVRDRIDFQRHDLAHSFPEGTFDLVSAQYLQSPVAFPRDRVLQRAASAVAPGGLLLVVSHASVAPWSWNQDPRTRFPTPEEALAALDLIPGMWHTERLGAPERQATGPNGESATVRDNVVAVRRLAS